MLKSRDAEQRMMSLLVEQIVERAYLHGTMTGAGAGSVANISICQDLLFGPRDCGHDFKSLSRSSKSNHFFGAHTVRWSTAERVRPADIFS
jgi:hypothetical protein